MQYPKELGRTLKFFRHLLLGGDRTWADLMRDLSHYIQCARLSCNGEEFYFDGRTIPNGCGYNGGILPYHNDHSYGIHT
jgi:hypothetical protein